MSESYHSEIWKARKDCLNNRSSPLNWLKKVEPFLAQKWIYSSRCNDFEESEYIHQDAMILKKLSMLFYRLAGMGGGLTNISYFDLKRLISNFYRTTCQQRWTLLVLVVVGVGGKLEIQGWRRRIVSKTWCEKQTYSCSTLNKCWNFVRSKFFLLGMFFMSPGYGSAGWQKLAAFRRAHKWPQNFRQARNCYFCDVCVVSARNCKFTYLIWYNMQYIPCNSAYLAQ